MVKSKKILLFIISFVSLLLLISAFSFYMLFWRMDNEPGYALKPSDYSFLYIAGVFFITGMAGTVIPNLLLYRERKRNIYIVLIGYIIMLVLILPPLFIFLLVMLS